MTVSRPRRLIGRAVLATGLALAVAVVAGDVQPAYADSTHPKKITVAKTPSVRRGKTHKAEQRPSDPAAAAALQKTPIASWPVASSRSVSMSAALAGTGRTRVPVAGTPVTLDAPIAPGSKVMTLPPTVRGTTPSSVHVEVLSHDAAVRAGQALLVRVGRADGKAAAGKVNVTINYGAFRNAYGGDWANRLRLVTVPACAGCQPRPLPFRNEVASTSVTATVDLAATSSAGLRNTAATGSTVTTLALTSGSSGPAGDFTATPLKASETWSGGDQSGDFTWSYPMRTPPANYGPQPTVGLSYSSQSVDGEMAASNNQPSWIGEGFFYQPGSITRTYKACADDMGGTATNTTKTGDLCWGSYNATLSLPGHSSELIRDDGDGHYSLKDDDGSKVELLTNATNGDNNGEYWRVTTSDGTKYYFGLNHLAGWASGNATTNSAFTVPVFGNNPGEPCYSATFASAYCSQAWRWNLDYIVDAYGDTMSYWYTQETNKYARNQTSSSISSYVRGGYLTRIDYGTDQHTSSTDSDLSAKAPFTVDFTPADRCVTAGATCTSSTPSNWPDVPWDRACTSNTSCTDYSPTFFSQKRLDTVQTSVWNATSSAYDPVEKWTLHQSYPDPGDSTRAGLWLSSISHTGLYGGTATVPDVQFTGTQLQNRVDTSTDGTPKMNWWRIASITTETGDLIGVSYSSMDCAAGSTLSPDANTKRCYPVYWTRAGETSPRIDWFHKYVVTAMSENDLTGGAPRVYTTYTYGTPAWHYDQDDGIVPASRKTWAQWRGYDTVTTTVGDTGDPQTSTRSLYFQGMNGDKTSSGTRSVQVTDSTGATVGDDDPFAGMLREKIVYNGPGGAEVSGEIDDPWKSAATASRTINGYTVKAYHTGTAANHNREDLDGGRGVRRTETDTTFDSYGMPTQVWDKGDSGKTGDDTCAITTYNRNTTANILDTIGRVQNYAEPCGTSPASDADVISDTENSFDGQAYGTAPTKGDITTVQTAKTWTTTSIGWLTTAISVYDAYGRVTDASDVRGNHTLTAYTPSGRGPITAIKTTKNPLGWINTTEIAPGYGLTTGSVDANNKRTDTTYDPLGRTTAIWTPTRSKATKATANATFGYQISQSTPSVVTTNILNSRSTYVPSYALYDGLLRARQTQQLAVGGGRTITDTFYNSLGETTKTSGPYYNSGTPGTTLFPTPIDQNVPSQTVNTFDGAGRTVRSAFVVNAITQWHTTTTYGGDHTDVTPAADAATPRASTPNSTITDALGRTVELRQYPGTSVSGTAYNTTTYAFNEKGQNTRVTDSAGNAWTYTYDLLGRITNSTAPDSGVTATTYNDYGDVTSVTDAVRQTVSYDYTLPAGYADPLGRKTSEWLGAVSTGTKLASWTYDTVAKGYPTSSSRWAGTSEYKKTVGGYNNLYQPTVTTTTIPATEALAGTYTLSATYNLDGTINQQTLPDIGDLGYEDLYYTYDSATGHPYSLSTDYGGSTKQIVLSAQYTSYGEPTLTTLADSSTSPFVQQSLTYENGTHRLAEAKTIKSTSPANVGDVHYTYDAAGNIRKAADTPTGGTADTQCYTYDDLQRLSNAWTPADGDCTTPASTGNLGGAAPYWRSWTFDGTGVVTSTGNRITETTHSTGGDTVVTSAYDQAGHPHGVSGTTTTVGGTQTGTAAYTYDADGHTTSRPGGNGQQTLTWDAENHLSTLTDTSGTYSYVYNPDGSRLLAHDPTASTLYLGNVELRLTTASNTKTAQRYYTFNGQTVAQRTASGLQFLSCDPHGTSTIAIDDTTTQTVTKRYQDPYGNPVGPNGTWVGTKTFVGGDQDPTVLIHEGAREYDPALGRFISIDPILDKADPQQLNGYAYAGNNPTTLSDPSGLRAQDPDLDNQFGTPDKGTGKNIQPGERQSANGRGGGGTGEWVPTCGWVRINCGQAAHSSRQNGIPKFLSCTGICKPHPAPKTQPVSNPPGWQNPYGASPCDWFGRDSDQCKASTPQHRRLSGGSGGICGGFSINLWFVSGSVSGCYMRDDHGDGFTLSREFSTGIAGGPVKGSRLSSLGVSLGGGFTGSTGTVPDQKGYFDTQNYGAGYGLSGTFSRGTGLTLDNKPEETDTLMVGAGDGIVLSGGTSKTKVWYWPYD